MDKNYAATPASDLTAADLLVEGIKYDGDKPRMELIPPWSELEIAKVLTFGAKKYSPENWRKVPDLQNRYMAGLKRHVNAIQRGEMYDPESGYYHHAHAMCCLMFLLEDLILTKNDQA